MQTYKVIAIGASAGGVETLVKLVASLPSDLPAAVLIVLHIPSYHHSLLPTILNYQHRLPAVHPNDGEPLSPGKIYVARPDQHMLITSEDSKAPMIRLTRGPREHGHRPAVDTLFRSVARVYRSRAIGVILSGMLDDGSLGLRAIGQSGGVTIVQEPSEALFPGMPQNAISLARVDYILPLTEIAQKITDLAYQSVQVHGGIDMDYPGEPKLTEEDEDQIVQQNKHDLEERGSDNQPTFLTCPDCGGVLWELTEGGQLRYRCHVGHSYSADTLFDEQGNALEQALWTAIRALEERAAFSRRIAHRAHSRDLSKMADRYDNLALEAESSAHVIRKVVESGNYLNVADTSDVASS